MDAKILSETIHSSTFNGALAGDHAVAQGLVEEHVVVIGSVGDEGVNLEEGTFVQKEANTVSSGSSTA